jgi:hypothetical protein
MVNIMQKRKYRKVTPRTIANHATLEIIEGNATAALRALEPSDGRTDRAVTARAGRIVAKRDNETAAQYIENSLEQISGDAIERVAELVNSEDERIATKNAHFVIEHIRGKAVQRSVSITGKLNIQSVLD